MSPNGDWLVLYDDALNAWAHKERPSPERYLAVLNWIDACSATGPPDDYIPVQGHEDLYVSKVAGGNVLAEYLALNYERRMVIRQFRFMP